MYNGIVRVKKSGAIWSKMTINEFDGLGELHNKIMRKMVRRNFYSQEGLIGFLSDQLIANLEESELETAMKTFEETIGYIEKRGIPNSVEDIKGIRFNRKKHDKMLNLIESGQFFELAKFSRRLSDKEKAVATIAANQFGNSQFGQRPFVFAKWPWSADASGATIGGAVGGPIGAGVGAVLVSGLVWLGNRGKS